MTDVQIVSNPFALMMNPEAVLAAVARSERLDLLKRRVCRPLDKPVGARPEDDQSATLDDASDAAEDGAAP